MKETPHQRVMRRLGIQQESLVQTLMRILFAFTEKPHADR